MFHFALSLVRMSCGLRIQKDSSESVHTTYCWLTFRREPSQRGRCREDRFRAEVLTRFLDMCLPT
jgi:hypothetical protein